MSAEEAADALGVTVTTLYAYVSRKGIRSEKQPGSKSRRYWRADIEQARKRGRPADPSAGLIGSTAVTLMTPKGPFYRGVSAVELAETATIEEVAGLLWNAPTAFAEAAPFLPPNYGEVLAALGDLPRIPRAIALFSLLEHANPRAHDLTPQGYARTGAEAVRCFAALVSGGSPNDRGPIHVMLARDLGLPTGYGDMIRRCLVLAADHELDPTTYAVRAAANTGVTPYGAAMAGLVAGRGRRLHLARAETVSRFVEEFLTGDPREAVLSRFRVGEPLPGFGRYLYADKDPRAQALIASLEQHAPAPMMQRFRTAADTIEDLTGAAPDFIVPTVLLGKVLGLKGEELAVSTVGRMVGWIAHALEQYQDNELFRPRASYRGPLPARSEPASPQGLD
ncbi:citrate synthase family protein [Caulobacter segnis]|uniref:citrate synthase family protein n=1 Tax=Caulobacter segnis TaxID=88688 RepID=UPI002866B139|nr:citrate synthase family protein [Caulobacter segnis]MDR6625884.1 citrate synthase [Caulobacter segnis]